MNSDEALATLQRVLSADPAAAERDELAELVRSTSRLRGLLDAFDSRCARRSRQLAEAGASESPASLLGRHGNRSGRAARQVAERERAGDEMPDFEHAMGNGDLSAEHLDVIATITRGVSDELRAEFNSHQPELLAAAVDESVEAFTRRCRDLVKRLAAAHDSADSDAAELDRQRARCTVRRWTDTITGMGHTHIELDPVRDAELWSGIDAHIARLRTTSGNRTLTWQQLQAQAVVDAVSAGCVIETDHDLGSGGDPDDVADHRVGPDPDIGVHDGGAPIARQIGDRLAEAISARYVGATRRTARTPSPTQRVPEVTVLVGLDVLTKGAEALGVGGTGICETVDGRPLPVSTVRRMCCDAEILPAVLDGNGEVTDLGRSRRTASRAQRRKLAAMHRTCAHPDCTVGFSACRIHHVRWWWRDHGRSDMDNLLPLCEVHHHLVHEGGWELTLTPDRVATWTRPDGTVWHTGPTLDRVPITRRATRAA